MTHEAKALSSEQLASFNEELAGWKLNQVLVPVRTSSGALGVDLIAVRYTMRSDLDVLGYMNAVRAWWSRIGTETEIIDG